ncbi:hypothetical protein [Jannaschia seohaensis]|uniref:DUF302 domain-containing protein n=1 Tax=Jannaschia seohaensis TaxID=475081 RepID=A0A2Y9AKF3_9RHOB|nr:hypothetical protein [Jannaschia seohaensis]PWJ20549.1 hypothetical protein BCF38_103368 [Jannaschia seohaensis]SSA44645.1 hypothetical protein SAMN05421539_103368 [Jannaschia seohaensis]
MTRRLLYAAAFATTLGVAGLAGLSLAQGMHGPAHGSGHGFVHGHGFGMHDETNMPGLRGENATQQESAELAVMFRNFDTITREVENLPNGIRTVTRSSDPEVMDVLVSHAVGMIDRVGRKDDPKIFIQSPTLDVFFLRGDEIRSEVEVTDEGLVVIQTSDNPVMVEALQVHAAEVTDMADRGMAAVHDMMMQQQRRH